MHKISLTRIVFVVCSVFLCCSVFAQSPGGVTPKAWFKANGTMTLSGVTVTQWNNNASGATVHLNTTPTGDGATTANALPTYTSTGFNFNPIVGFNGLQGIYNSSALGSNFISNNNNSYFIVFSGATSTSGVMAKWEKLSSNRISFEMGSTSGATKLRADFPTSSDQSKSTTTISSSVGYLGNVLTSSSEDSLYVNGVAETVKTISTSADNTQTGGMYLGCNPTGTYPYTGNISEVIFYDTKLGDVSKRKVQSYLAIKYGITLGTISSTVDYVNSSNTTIWTGSATYQNNITGIGRDDNSGLNQKQSLSVSGSGVVTMAILSAGSGNSIPSANASNANTFSADNTFLVYGDNAGSLYGNSSDLPASIVKKSARIWKSQLTGTGLAAQNVRLKFDLSSLSTLTISDYTAYRLLLDADGTFAAGATAISPVTGSNGSMIVEFDVTMATYTSYYFTIGTTNATSAPLPLEFLSFTLKKQNESILLNWETYREINCKNIEIEWSRDAVTWYKIGAVDATNQYSQINEYSFLDSKPHSGLNYYRLKQVDLDEGYIYSVVKSINIDQLLHIIVEPVPADMYFDLVNEEANNIPFIVTDVNGKIIYKNEITSQNQLRVNTEAWSSGIYIIDFLLDDKTDVQKIVVKH